MESAGYGPATCQNRGDEMHRSAVVILTVLLPLGLIAAPALADEDGKYYYLNNRLQGGEADEVFAYGASDDEVFVGDWDGDGIDTLGVRRGDTYYLNNRLSGGGADEVFSYGRQGDEVFVGDWDGDGIDTLGLRRGKTFYVSNRLRGGTADKVFPYGRHNDRVLVGDWDGDGSDSFGVRRGDRYHLNNRLEGGRPDTTFNYGQADDLVYTGDWDGDGIDTLGVRRGSTYHLNNRLRGGRADASFSYGAAGDITLVGDWDGDGRDTLGVRRNQPPLTLASFSGSGNDVISYNFDDVGPAIAEISHEGSSNFVVWAFNSKGEHSDLLVNEIGDYAGTVAANFDSSAGSHRGFDVRADGDWSIVIKDVAATSGFSPSGGGGVGDDVRRATRPAGETVRFEHSGSSNFIIWAVNSRGDRFDLLVNEIGDYSGRHRVPSGTAWLEIRADGRWTATW